MITKEVIVTLTEKTANESAMVFGNSTSSLLLFADLWAECSGLAEYRGEKPLKASAASLLGGLDS